MEWDTKSYNYATRQYENYGEKPSTKEEQLELKLEPPILIDPGGQIKQSDPGDECACRNCKN